MKYSLITLVFMLTFSTMANESCALKLPPSIQQTIVGITNALPTLMRKATGQFTPEYANQASAILTSISSAAKITRGGSTDRISTLLTSLGGKAKPFFDMWKQKGKLDQGTIDTAVKNVTATINAIKRAAKIK